MMNLRLVRRLQWIIFVATFFVLFASYYFEHVKNMQPCPLCIMQRYSVFLFLVFCLLALRFKDARRSRRIVIAQLVFAGFGLFFAGRQLWLQSAFVSEPVACMPGLDVLIQYMPWQDILHALFWGAGECAEVQWAWLGLSMAAWSAIYFCFAFIASLVIFTILSRSLAKADPSS